MNSRNISIEQVGFCELSLRMNCAMTRVWQPEVCGLKGNLQQVHGG